MDKKLLKGAASSSVILLIVVLMTTFLLPVYRLSHGNDNKDLEILSDQLLGHQSVSNIEKELKLEIEEISGDVPFSNLKEGDRYLILKKPQGTEISMEVENLFLSKGIRVSFNNLTKRDITAEWIGRVNQGEVFYGQPQVTFQEIDSSLNGKEMLKDVIREIEINWNHDSSNQTYEADIMISLDHVYDLRIEENEQSYYIYLRRPKEVYNKVIVIDAGHGGKDAGAIGADGVLCEKQINLQVLLELNKQLDEDNIKVYYTRTEDQQVYLRPRVELANDVDADFFISIHSNASVIPKASGIDIYYYDDYHHEISTKEFATLILDELVKVMPLRNRGITERKGDEIYILENASVPAVIIEMGYITNYNDMGYLKNHDNQKTIAKGIYNGISLAYKKFYNSELIEKDVD